MATTDLSLQIEDVDSIENQIRAERRPAPDAELPVSAMVYARTKSGMGSNLENACPFIRGCELDISPTKCVGSQNYRPQACYKTSLALEIL